MICIAIITLLKIRNGRISVRYPDFLKNGVFFNIIRSVGDICTLESKHDHCGDEVEDVHNNFHNQCF
ncbi:hypothetical protein AXA88_24015 [Salmonella enterica]|nr:hypothetical protein [Salmonella enterica]EAX3608925.1 hypothetical protein [Salmonella enterica]ECH6755803.1 hypothetical protein [Salmonella enterica subsp. enterica serovar Newport]EGW6282463.1 hypothetical protein [Salmonella enterica]EGX3934946.1 hypothetical protein [Salmonella enterica]